ncbi:MAG: hypothetical protein M3167_06260 [Acidobacteriota bacterium]|nr:hypothetical protein [Acidobacteriota bacterium]MDQ6892267.1 hypothetical protein [Acidobacteriota bacterium]
MDPLVWLLVFFLACVIGYVIVVKTVPAPWLSTALLVLGVVALIVLAIHFVPILGVGSSRR